MNARHRGGGGANGRSPGRKRMLFTVPGTLSRHQVGGEWISWITGLSGLASKDGSNLSVPAHKNSCKPEGQKELLLISYTGLPPNCPYLSFNVRESPGSCLVDGVFVEQFGKRIPVKAQRPTHTHRKDLSDGTPFPTPGKRGGRCPWRPSREVKNLNRRKRTKGKAGNKKRVTQTRTYTDQIGPRGTDWTTLLTSQGRKKGVLCFREKHLSWHEIPSVRGLSLLSLTFDTIRRKNIAGHRVLLYKNVIQKHQKGELTGKGKE